MSEEVEYGTLEVYEIHFPYNSVETSNEKIRVPREDIPEPGTNDTYSVRALKRKKKDQEAIAPGYYSTVSREEIVDLSHSHRIVLKEREVKRSEFQDSDSFRTEKMEE